MPFKTPQYMGKKEALEYLKMYPTVTKRIFMDEGRADIERDYKEKSSQERYIKGWESAWDEAIKQQVERMASCDIDSDLASDKDDFARSSSLIREKLEIEQKLSKRNIAVLVDEEDLEVWHVYIDGEKWQDFNAAEWQWQEIGEIAQ
jgi:hypothetical protein